MSMLLRLIDRVTMCRWRGHTPWLEESQSPFCDRCGKKLPAREIPPLPPPGTW